MSDPLASPSGPLTPDARRRIADVCTRFDRDWTAGLNPRIEDFLCPTSPPGEYDELLSALLEVEFYYRQRAGEALALNEYIQRFPDQAHTVRSIFHTEVSSRQLPKSGEIEAEKIEADGSAPASSAVPPALHQTTIDCSRRLPREKKTDARGRKAPGWSSSCPVRVGDYDILEELGRGSMGVVYRAIQRKLNRPVALKMILAGEHVGPEQIERFRAEAAVIARLQHPNIVQIHEVGEEAGQPFFSLELVEGGSLDRRIRGTPQPVRQAAALVVTLARAMHAAHRAGILHRDLKPANVLLSPKPDVAPEQADAELHLDAFDAKIGDFGLAKRLDDDSLKTLSRAVVGTPAYMAPEQAECRGGAIGPPTDVYALAAILYELLTGRVPFKGATTRETLEFVSTQEPLPPSRLQPKVPRDLETICLKGLRKDPRQRYGSASELADDLQRWLEGRPVRARPVGVWQRIWKYASRRPWVVAAWASGLAALLFLAVGGGYYLYRRSLDLEAELARQEALADVRLQAATRASAAEDALKKRDWLGAVAAANETLALVREEPALAELQEHARALRDGAQRVLRFNEQREQLMFHSVLALEEGDQRAHRQAAQTAARDGLALFGLTADGPVTPALIDGPSFGSESAQRLTEGCYEVYLTWAEVVAPGGAVTAEEQRAQANLALNLVERAAQLGLTTRSYHQRRAELLRCLGQPSAAQRELDQAAQIMPSLPWDHFLLARGMYRARNMEGAEDHLRRVLEQQPDHFWASYCLAACFLRHPARRFERALAPLSVCIQLKPDFAWPYLLRGFVHGELGDFEEALADFQTADKLRLDEVARYGLLTNRAAVEFRRGMDHEKRARQNPSEAAREMKSARACYDQAVLDLRSAVALRPQQPQAYVNLAEVYLRYGQWRQALTPLDRAIALAPSAALYRSRARLHENQRAYSEALEDLEKAIRYARDAHNLDLAGRDELQSGRILLRLGKHMAALEAGDRALADAPSLSDAHQLRGEALLELGRIAEAVEALDRFLAKGPSSAVASRARALGRAKLGNYAGAIEDYTHALEIERGNGRSDDPATLVYRGWAYLSERAPQLALKDFNKALQLPGCERADCLAGRGQAQVDLNQWRLAVADAEAALKEQTPTARMLYSSARIYAQAAERVRVDSAQKKGAGQELLRDYHRRAMELVLSAWQKTPVAERPTFWKNYVEADPALGLLGIREQLRAQLFPGTKPQERYP